MAVLRFSDGVFYHNVICISNPWGFVPTYLAIMFRIFLVAAWKLGYPYTHLIFSSLFIFSVYS